MRDISESFNEVLLQEFSKEEIQKNHNGKKKRLYTFRRQYKVQDRYRRTSEESFLRQNRKWLSLMDNAFKKYCKYSAKKYLQDGSLPPLPQQKIKIPDDLEPLSTFALKSDENGQANRVSLKEYDLQIFKQNSEGLLCDDFFQVHYEHNLF